MKFVYSDRYYLEIGPHVFPMGKYHLLKAELDKNGLVQKSDFIEPPPPVLKDILLVHTPEYIDDLTHLRWTPRTMYSELPLTPEIVEGYLLMASGTTLAAQLALKHGLGFHIGGGFHHAFADHAEGFCYINDIAVAVRRLLHDNLIAQTCVIDCDLHQGNGTANIFHNDPRVFTFSIHQEHLYPAKQESDWDIGLDTGTADAEYLDKLGGAVEKIFRKQRPELCVYVAGADPFEGDQLGNLRLTKAGLKKRDELVIGEARKNKIPTVVVLAGGYALRVLDTVEIHYNTCKVCKDWEVV